MVLPAVSLLSWDGGLSLLGPALAITVALLTRKVAPALAAGVVVTAIVAEQGDVIAGVAGAFTHVWESVTNVEEHLTITAFTMFVAAMVAVMGASGATRNLVSIVESRAEGPRGTMVASWLAGFVVFFDDYANCMVVGNAMGPVCDRNGVSRAKLAYIVDSTAAPVASLAVVGTWVGFEVGLLDEALRGVGSTTTGFELFISSLPYRFYGFFALFMVGVIAITGRDFGPMAKEERIARKIRRDPEPPRKVSTGHAFFSGIPILMLVGVTFAVLLADGLSAMEASGETGWHAVLSGADPYRAMFIGAGVGFGMALSMALGAGWLTPDKALEATGQGLQTLAEPLVILYLAWALGAAIGETEATAFIASALGGWFPAAGLPAAVFVAAGFMGFATGTSFGTMTVLIPLAVPLAIQMDPTNPALLAATTSAVLAGSCLGDHASPISDTTILSATGAQVDLVTHVRTQLPYALVAGLIALCIGYLPSGVGVSPLLTVPLGFLAVIAVVVLVGRPVEDA